MQNGFRSVAEIMGLRQQAVRTRKDIYSLRVEDLYSGNEVGTVLSVL